MGSMLQGVELMFGGKEFGINMAKCTNELITMVKKMEKAQG